MREGDEDALLALGPDQLATHAFVRTDGDLHVVVTLEGVVATIQHDDVLVVGGGGKDEVLHLAV